jgi:hypothetical protein
LCLLITVEPSPVGAHPVSDSSYQNKHRLTPCSPLYLKTRASPFRKTRTTGPTAINKPEQISVHRRQPQLQNPKELAPVGAHPVSDAVHY